MGLVLSVYDQAGADFAVNMGACALKVASSNIVHAPLIRYCASLKLPLIIDSGKSSREEVIRAVHWAQQAGAERLILEYSPPAPPAPVEQHNLRAISDLRKIFSGPLGLSDHHAGEEMLYAASALGYRLLEKGLCADNQFTDQDVFHALPLSQLATVMEKCRAIHAALGAASAAYTAPTKRPAARMGLVAAINLDVGDSLDSNTVRFAFPTLGIPVEDWDKVRQLQIKTPVAAGQPIEWQHVESTTAR
jgi:sialic acid synthase SpsE